MTPLGRECQIFCEGKVSTLGGSKIMTALLILGLMGGCHYDLLVSDGTDVHARRGGRCPSLYYNIGIVCTMFFKNWTNSGSCPHFACFNFAEFITLVY